MDSVKTYLTQLSSVIDDMPQDKIWDVVHVLAAAWRRRAGIFIIGNGGSAATASHMANDLNKLTIVPNQPRFKAMALTDNVPLMTAWGNDTSYDHIFAEQLLNFLAAGDVVIAISCSGNSPNVLHALQVARQHQAVTIGFTGDIGGQLAQIVDHCICVPSDHIGQQEDAHLILGHVIANTLRTIVEQASTAEVLNGRDRLHERAASDLS